MLACTDARCLLLVCDVRVHTLNDDNDRWSLTIRCNHISIVSRKMISQWHWVKDASREKYNPLSPIGNLTHENSAMNSPDFSTLLACTQPTHCDMQSCMHWLIILHTRMTTWACSLVHVRVESGRDQAGEDISGLCSSSPEPSLWIHI